MTELPSTAVSIVLEWETGEECGGGRAWRCLAALNAEIRAAAASGMGATELILVHDPVPATREDARAAARGLHWPGRFEIVEPPAALGYYEKKNHGFARSRGDIVLFVDSDLAPEAGWLEAMLAPFADPAKSVVVGRTHLETRTLYERATALFWIFDARCEEAAVRPTPRLVSNNIAFRRPLFAALPFPSRNTYRGQCSELGATLGGLGVKMYEATAARASHPAPASVSAFAQRAFRAGRDAAAYAAEIGTGRLEAFPTFRRDLESVRRRVAERAPLIGAGAADRAAGFVLGLVYYAIKAVGYATAPAPVARPRRASPA